jgi:hypothetical protein
MMLGPRLPAPYQGIGWPNPLAGQGHSPPPPSDYVDNETNAAIEAACSNR